MFVAAVETTALSDEIVTPNHWVKAPSTLAFADASIKTSSRGPIPMNALVTIDEETEVLAHDPRLGWIPKAHLMPIGAVLADPAAVALSHVGAPYLWGGRGSGGLDCSGLVQQALLACGLACPRDSDQQDALGEPAPAGCARPRRSGVLEGPRGMMMDVKRMVHANAFHMATAIEPLAKACARIAERRGGEPIAFRRLDR